MDYAQYSDAETGRQALQYYHNAMATLYSDYRISFAELIKLLSSRKGQANFLDGLGLAIHNAGLSDGQVANAFDFLAKTGKGKIPASNYSFSQVLIDEGSSINFVDMTKYVANQTAKDVLKGSVAVGNTIINSGGNALAAVDNTFMGLKYALPVIVIGGLGFFVYMKAK